MQATTYAERKKLMLQVINDDTLTPKEQLQFAYHWFAAEWHHIKFIQHRRNRDRHGKYLNVDMRVYDFRAQLDKMI